MDFKNESADLSSALRLTGYRIDEELIYSMLWSVSDK